MTFKEIDELFFSFIQNNLKLEWLVINHPWFLICSWTFHHLTKLFLRNLNFDENKSLHESTRSTNIHLEMLWAIIQIFL